MKIFKEMYRLLNWVLGLLLEPMMSAVLRENEYSKTPIFIIGPPRSGTTLTFQLVTKCLNLGYLNNLHGLFYGLPAAVSLLTRRKTRQENFSSDHGLTPGLLGPSECGQWWYRFFPRDPVYVTRDIVAQGKLLAFRRSLVSIASVECRPVVFKNLFAGMRLDAIVSAFPDALFIYVSRDLRDNAHSILEGRLQATGSFLEWWSVPPPGYERLLGLPPEVQVVEQIRTIHGQLEMDIERLSLEPRVMRLKYENVCKDPRNFIDQLEVFLSMADVKVDRVSPPPKEFTISKKSVLPTDLTEKLEMAIRSVSD